MIVVIADDLSGAAEMATLAVDHGLRAEVQSRFHACADVDVVAVNTDSRSATAQQAARRVDAVSWTPEPLE